MGIIKLSFRLLILLAGLFRFVNGTLAQIPDSSLGDDWLLNHKGLQVGEKMPDINFGEILNNTTGKTSFSDFKGKLVILDFWNSYCTSCILFFPKMEKLQKEFGDKIQIILVNTTESEETIKKRFSLRRNMSNSKLPNLPSIVNASGLSKLFPTRFVPHHVWIDQNSIIRVIGPAENTYSEKIQSILAGRDISFVKGENTNPEFNSEISYHKIMGKKFKRANYSSLITAYNPEYSPYSGGSVVREYDTVLRAQRNTWINKTGWDLFLFAYPNIINVWTEKVICSTYPMNTLFLVADTVRYTDDFKSRKADNYQLKDLDIMKSRICYEQIAPLQYSKNQLLNLMRVDLNNYFHSKYGTKVSVKKKTMMCWVLKKISDRTFLSTSKEFKSKDTLIEGEMMVAYKNATFNGLIRSYFYDTQLRNSINEIGNFHFIDETDIGSNSVDIILPKRENVGNMEDLKRYLNKCNLTIIQEKKEIEFLVFEENYSSGLSK